MKFETALFRHHQILSVTAKKLGKEKSVFNRLYTNRLSFTVLSYLSGSFLFPPIHNYLPDSDTMTIPFQKRLLRSVAESATKYINKTHRVDALFPIDVDV